MRSAVRPMLLLAGALLALAGCVIVPYRPAAQIHEDPSTVANADRLRLSAGPRQRLESMARGVLRANGRFRQVDGQALLDAASPGQDLTLARLLEPSTRARLEPLDVDYVVLFGKPVSRDEKTRGEMVLYLGFFGAMQQHYTNSYWTTVIDARRLQVLGQATAESRGTMSGIGAFYGLFIVGDSDGSARVAAIRHVAARLAAARPSGAARVAFLAVEPIPTAEELAAQARREERERVLRGTRWSMDFPSFAAMAAPPAGQALVYVYRPDTRRVPPPSILEVTSGAADAAGRVASIRAAGYHGFYAPAGELRITVASGSSSGAKQSITLMARSGETYFVRATVAAHLLGANAVQVAIVDAGRGLRELQRCRRMPSAREYDLETQRRADYGSDLAQLELSVLLRTGSRYADGTALAADPVAAYMWLEIARQRASAPTARLIARDQRALAGQLDAAQLAEAIRRARLWLDAADASPP